MSVKGALVDLIRSIETLHWVDEVKIEETERSSKGYRVTVLLGSSSNDYRTRHKRRVTQEFLVRLEVVGSKAQTDNVLDKATELEDRINQDPRRNGEAQTTVTPGWTIIEQGRSGATLEQTISIEINELEG